MSLNPEFHDCQAACTVKSISIDHLIRVCRLVRQEVLKGYAPQSCLATCKYVGQVLSELGVQVRALPIQLLVMNQPYVEQVNRVGRFPKGEELTHWSRQENAWSVGLGFGEASEPSDTWPGHLVLMVTIADALLLVDPSIDQVNHPERLIKIDAPVILPVPQQFPQAGNYILVEQDQCLLHYTAQPGNTSFQQTPAWQRSFATEPILQRLGLVGV